MALLADVSVMEICWDGALLLLIPSTANSVPRPTTFCSRTIPPTAPAASNAPTNNSSSSTRRLAGASALSTQRLASPRTSYRASSTTQYDALPAAASTASTATTRTFVMAIRALNSTLGVTSDVVQGLIDNTIRCSACSCQYSFDGYNAHIRDGLCGNKPNPTPVTPASHRAPYYGLDTRELPPGKRLEKFAEFLDTPIGASMLEWNSKLGIPTDV
ncbi:hypothetical protein R3P38DRAFT_3227381 [Favolaschia claudopus]|uniref:Uncharacterized protein n=1 Tax=Favolaschia claudopus TaxID=2862362 RepID=A0AAV9ZS01_9AGAR